MKSVFGQNAHLVARHHVSIYRLEEPTAALRGTNKESRSFVLICGSVLFSARYMVVKRGRIASQASGDMPCLLVATKGPDIVVGKLEAVVSPVAYLYNRWRPL